jgi:hypothetical protein
MAENENLVLLFYLYYVLFIMYSAMLNNRILQTIKKRGMLCRNLLYQNAVKITSRLWTDISSRFFAFNYFG